MSDAPILTLKDVQKKYSRKGKNVLQDISFSVSAGEIVGILGNNGSGKTTLIKTILGLLEADKGTILFDGKNSSKIKKKAYYTDVTAVLEGERNLYWFMSAMENILYSGRLKGLKDADIKKQAMEYLEMFTLLQEKDTKVGDMSRGMQQKLSLIISLLGNPRLILLDEPTLGLDIMAKRDLISCLKNLAKEKNTAVLITSHQTDVIDETVERIILIDKNRICFDGSTLEFKRAYSKKKTSICILGQADDFIKKNFITRQNADSFEITTESNSQKELLALLQTLSQNGYEILSFMQDSASLEDILMNFYKRSN